MSSIIDALKKSDDSRHTEGASQLDQIKFGNQPDQPNRKGFWLLVMFLLFVALGVYGWQQGWHHGAINQFNSWFGSETVAATENQTTDAGNDSTTAPRNSTAVTADPAPKTNRLTPPKPQEIKAKASTQAQPTVDEVSGSKMTSPDTSQQGSRQAKAMVPPPEQIKNAEAADTLTVVERREPVSEPDRKILQPTLQQDYLLLHQIDFAVRKEIPPIKLTVHIYDPEPEKRMILLNGSKYNVGDTIEDVIEVKDITKEGVVLNFRDIQFLIPK